MTGWNPWRALRNQPDVELVWADIPSGATGACFELDGRTVVVVSHGLRRRQRNATLAHELIHSERGIFYTPTTPRRLVEKEERAVDLEVARRLVPADELERFVAERLTIEPVTVAMVADEFDVPHAVARRAMIMMRRAG